MKTVCKLPCLPGWAISLSLGLLALLPAYGYIRVMILIAAAVTAAYCALACLRPHRPDAARVLRAVLDTVMILGICIGCLTGGAILAAGTQTPQNGLNYIIVLGAKVEDGGASPSLRERIDAAYAYLTENPDTIAVVSGGKGADEPITEASCMYDALVDMGISPERIWLEDQATSTWENLKLSLDVIEEKTGTRPNRVGVVSSEFHLFRVSRQACDWGLEVSGIPAKTQAPDRFIHYFIREIAGIWHYLILGGTP